jgi:hypothetical protein
MKQGPAYRIGRRAVIWLPACLFVCAITLPFTPGMFTDSPSPWYKPAAQLLLEAALFYAFPVTLLCTRLVSDDMFLSPGYDLVLAIYTVMLMFLLRSIFRFFERRSSKST